MASQASHNAVAPIGAVEQVSDAQLARYADLIYARTGIRVSPQKKLLLSNRLRRRLRSTGIKTFEEYYQHLKQLPPHDPEWDAFIQEITTHETYLFRDEAQWDWFRNEYLPGLAASSAVERPAGRACGSGRRRAAPATRRTPRPAASRPACRSLPMAGSHSGHGHRPGRRGAGEDRRVRPAGDAAGARGLSPPLLHEGQGRRGRGRPSRS